MPSSTEADSTRSAKPLQSDLRTCIATRISNSISSILANRRKQNFQQRIWLCRRIELIRKTKPIKTLIYPGQFFLSLRQRQTAPQK